MSTKSPPSHAIARRAWQVLALLSMTPITAFAANTLTVTTLADSGPGSLRATIATAASGDSVVFASGLSGTVALNASLVLDKSLTIDGGRRITLDGSDATRVLRILAPASVMLRGLTVQRGRATNGAGILNESNLTLDTCVVRDNNATEDGGGIAHFGARLTVTDSDVVENQALGGGGGVVDRGSTASGMLRARVGGNRSAGPGAGIWQQSGQLLTIDDSTLIGNHVDERFLQSGGGISSNSSNLWLRHVTVSGNIAPLGGGVFSRSVPGETQGDLTIDNSLIANNIATADGGGGLLLSGVDANLFNSTVSQNLAPRGTGGGIAATATGGFSENLGLLHVTVAFNTAADSGGGIARFGMPITITRSLIAENDALNGPDISGSFLSLGYNLVRHRSGSSGYVASDLPDLTSAMLEPLFAVGGATSVHDLAPGSPAIDAIPLASCAGISSDQRDFPRPSGAGCDIGAVEVGNGPPPEAVFADGFD